MKPNIIVHGGSGQWSDKLDAPKADFMREAARIGWQILQNGGSALDAIEKAVNYLEDAPIFDAGTGSHLNADGVVEMDALIIDGTRMDFGAVAAVQRVRYPITLARGVLDNTVYNFFAGAGADALASKLGLPLVANIALVTEHEWQVYLRQQKDAQAMGTVGAVAIDENGNIASATSTGGSPHKPAGRVGDSPLFGAGGYADSRMGAASATGVGEQSMRLLLSKYAVDQIGGGMDAQAAADAALRHADEYFAPSLLGIILVDHAGRIGAAHTTPKIAVGWVDADGEAQATMQGGTTQE